jgi:protein-S-isoprenylcysteine O-methyltransferase Ste14
MSLQYRNAQTALLCAFAALFFLDNSASVEAMQWPSLGAVLCMLGLVLMLAAFVSLRAVIQVAPEPKAGGRLVTSGPYRWLRHPIYTGMVLLFVGLFFRKPTAAIGIASVVVITFLIAKSRFEEELLQERYPDYLQYKMRSWGIIPGLR